MGSVEVSNIETRQCYLLENKETREDWEGVNKMRMKSSDIADVITRIFGQNKWKNRF